ncbi:hypothetical protein DHC50_18140 [Arenibacter sp. A80]|nr:hypothetical protein [Arenibacter sp. A80]RFT54985.1 hypothetical protein D0S24_18135 [Arenibacter sp. P308M17]
MTLNRNNRNFKIVRLYLISLVCIVCYFVMENYNVINELFKKSRNFRYHGFITLVFTGLLQYGLLTVGICIFIFLSFMLIREKIKND